MSDAVMQGHGIWRPSWCRTGIGQGRCLAARPLPRSASGRRA